ncbi:hypothetical protein pb186bvf_011451 [Paramecium bursaria]
MLKYIIDTLPLIYAIYAQLKLNERRTFKDPIYQKSKQLKVKVGFILQLTIIQLIESILGLLFLEYEGSFCSFCLSISLLYLFGMTIAQLDDFLIYFLPFLFILNLLTDVYILRIFDGLSLLLSTFLLIYNLTYKNNSFFIFRNYLENDSSIITQYVLLLKYQPQQYYQSTELQSLNKFTLLQHPLSSIKELSKEDIQESSQNFSQDRNFLIKESDEANSSNILQEITQQQDRLSDLKKFSEDDNILTPQKLIFPQETINIIEPQHDQKEDLNLQLKKKKLQRKLKQQQSSPESQLSDYQEQPQEIIINQFEQQATNNQEQEKPTRKMSLDDYQVDIIQFKVEKLIQKKIVNKIPKFFYTIITTYKFESFTRLCTHADLQKLTNNVMEPLNILNPQPNVEKLQEFFDNVSQHVSLMTKEIMNYFEIPQSIQNQYLKIQYQQHALKKQELKISSIVGFCQSIQEIDDLFLYNVLITVQFSDQREEMKQIIMNADKIIQLSKIIRRESINDSQILLRQII